MSGKPGLDARRAAARFLSGVLADRKMLSMLPLDRARLAPTELARAQSLATGVLRHLPRLDAVLSTLLDRPPPPAVQQVLRLAAYELLVERTAAYAVVDGAVSQVRAGKHARFAGLVNAVGRRVAELPQTVLPEPALPNWLQKPVAREWGDAAAVAIAHAHLQEPPLDLTLREVDQVSRLAGMSGVEHLPTGGLRLRGGAQVTALPGYSEGAWWVQDAAAALPVRLLGDVSGLNVVDLCAAPGGKTMQLAAAGAQVTAVDISEARLERLRENLSRTGLTAKVTIADALAWHPEHPPDIVVLDAPCSATGTLRRHPDLPYVRPAPDLSPLLDLQEALIDRALSWLPPGARLLYCTCSLIPREGETQIARARQRHPELLEGGALPGGCDPAWQSSTGALRLRPDYWSERGGMDGFFATVLTKPD